MKGAAQENRPPLGVEKSMLNFDAKKIENIPEMLGRMVRSYRFALAAFLVPLLIRSIPEILVGPYPIGWDTIAFYVPNTLDSSEKNKQYLIQSRTIWNGRFLEQHSGLIVSESGGP